MSRMKTLRIPADIPRPAANITLMEITTGKKIILCVTGKPKTVYKANRMAKNIKLLREPQHTSNEIFRVRFECKQTNILSFKMRTNFHTSKL